MKRVIKLEWFKVGDIIPNGSKFIKSEIRKVNGENVEFFLYEVIYRG